MYKERQVFSALSTLQRVSNPRVLSYLALIQTVENYVWGVRNAANNASNFWGTSMSRTYRDSIFTKFLDGITDIRINILSKYMSLNVIYENIMREESVRDQRGRFSRFLAGTHQAAHKGRPYLDTRNYNITIKNSYDESHITISPMGMRVYETIDFKSDHLETSAYLNHDQLSVGPGKRNANRKSLLRTAWYINTLKSVFSSPDDHYNKCPDHLNTTHLIFLPALPSAYLVVLLCLLSSCLFSALFRTGVMEMLLPTPSNC